MIRSFLIVVMSCLALAGRDTNSMAGDAVAQIELPESAPQLPIVGDINKGKKVAEQCADCHGLDGVSARSGAPFIAGLEQEYLVRSLIAYRNGARNHAVMKQVGDELNPMTMADVTAYYASLDTAWKGAIADQQSKSILKDTKARSAGKHIVEGCRSCHSQTDRYQREEAIPNLDGLPVEYFVPALKSYVNGERKNEIMSQFKGSLSDQDIYNLAAYFAARVPIKAPPMGNGNPANGKMAARACAGCHGYDGNSLNPNIPNLAGQSSRYLIKATKDYRYGLRQSLLMSAPVEKLNDKTIADLAAYYSRQQPQSQLHKDITSDKAFDPLADGEKIAASCNSCHGDKGNSKEPGVPSLTGMHVKYILNATQAYQQGLRQHTAMQEIVSFYSDTDIEKAAYYYAMQQPMSEQQPRKGNVENGEMLSSACISCHGEQGVSPDPAATPSLAGQDEAYLINATKAYASGKRSHDGMRGVAAELSDQDLADLAAYFSVQTPKQVVTYLPDNPQQLVEERCNRCHGEGGYSSKPGVPRLAGQIESYIVLAMKEYQAGMRKDKTMVAMAGVLSLLEIKAIAAYYAKQ